MKRESLFKILPSIGCPSKLQSHIESFHINMKRTVPYEGSTSETFDINSGVKQVGLLAPTLFGIYFASILKHALDTKTEREGVYLHTSSDGRLFHFARLKTKTKLREALIGDMLFADDVAAATQTRGTPVSDESLLWRLQGHRDYYQSEKDECLRTGGGCITNHHYWRQ